MGLAIRMAAAVTAPVLTGVLVWWGVMLAAPVVLICRWHRRRRVMPRRRRWVSAAHARRAEASPRSPAGAPSGVAASGGLAGGPGRRADAAELPRPLAGALPAPGRTPSSRAEADSK